MTNYELIVNQLKTNPSQAQRNVVQFGSALPAGTYVVVKIEPTGLGYDRVRVTPHMAKGQGPFLDAYCATAYDLLAYKELVDAPSGRRIKLKFLGFSQVVTNNSDATISMDAIFSMPTPVFR